MVVIQGYCELEECHCTETLTGTHSLHASSLDLLELLLFCGLHRSDLDVFSRLWRVGRLAFSTALFRWNVDFHECLLNSPRSDKAQRCNKRHCSLAPYRRFR